MARDWSIREYSTRDKQGVFELRKAVYGESFDEQEWEWKFENGPVDPARIYVADSDGMIVGLRVFLLSRLQIMNESWTCGVAVDGMVHPDFRRHGIWSSLVREGLNKISKQGVNIACSFPGTDRYTYLGFRKLQWSDVCSMPLLAKPLRVDNIVKKYIKMPLLQKLAKLLVKIIVSICLRQRLRKTSDILIERIRSFDDRFDELWQRASRELNIAVVRDSKCLNWRYADKPGPEYTIFSAERGGNLAGYMVLTSSTNMFDLALGLIVDILTIEEDVTDSLISQAVEYFESQKVDAIGCLMLKHSPYYRALKKAGFVLVPRTFSPREFHFVLHVDSSNIPETVVNKPDNWFLTWGDFDIV